MVVMMNYIFDIKAVSTGAFAAMVALLGQHWVTRLAAPGWFMLILLGLMTVELYTRYRRAPEGGGTYPWERQIAGKIMLVAMVVTAFLLDLLVIGGMYWGSLSQPEIGPWGKGLFIITTSTQIWLCAAESFRIVDHIAHHTGEENIPPMVLWVIRQLRRTDKIRFQQQKGDAAPPPRRWYDDMSEDDVKELLRYFNKRDDK
jgi:hypothetical protein